MTVKELMLIEWLRTIMHQRGLNASQLSVVIEVSHPTVGRWLKGEDIPSAKSCGKLAELTGTPVSRILALAGHVPYRTEKAGDLPDFREYMSIKYPNVNADYVDTVARGIEVQKRL